MIDIMTSFTASTTHPVENLSTAASVTQQSGHCLSRGKNRTVLRLNSWWEVKSWVTIR